MSGLTDHAPLVKTLRGMDAVMHFAGSAYVGESIDNPRKYFRNNVESALLADLTLCWPSDVRLFVFSSSCATYGVPQRPAGRGSRRPRTPSTLMA